VKEILTVDKKFSFFADFALLRTVFAHLVYYYATGSISLVLRKRKGDRLPVAWFIPTIRLPDLLTDLLLYRHLLRKFLSAVWRRAWKRVNSKSCFWAIDSWYLLITDCSFMSSSIDFWFGDRFPMTLITPFIKPTLQKN